MPGRAFSDTEKVEIRQRLLDVGFPMLKENGLTHMSIPKIASAAGIGTGTFYKFFESKEVYVYEMIKYRRKLLLGEVITEDIINGKKKLSRTDVKRIIELIVDKEKSVYANLTLKDEAKLFEKIEAFSPDLNHEAEIVNHLVEYIDEPQAEIDVALLTNLVKVLAITSQAKEELHEQGYHRTIDFLIESILGLIFR